MIEAFPLTWPAGFARHTGDKVTSKFVCTLGQARDGVNAEIERMGGYNVIVSTNIPLKRDGQFYASMQPVDGDHGAAVYFTWNGDQVVLACDQYKTLRENLRAIEKSIEAMRGLERWGCSDILKRTFTGFKALPESANTTGNTWWQVLEVPEDASMEFITFKYKKAAKRLHPDVPGGDKEKFQKLQSAYDYIIAIRGRGNNG